MDLGVSFEAIKQRNKENGDLETLHTTAMAGSHAASQTIFLHFSPGKGGGGIYIIVHVGILSIAIVSTNETDWQAKDNIDDIWFAYKL